VKPSFFDFKGQAKWTAWESRKGLKKEKAPKKNTLIKWKVYSQKNKKE